MKVLRLKLFPPAVPSLLRRHCVGISEDRETMTGKAPTKVAREAGISPICPLARGVREQ